MRVGYRVGMVLLALLTFAVGESRPVAGQAAWQPSPGHTQLPIWPGVAPDARPVDGPEVAGTVVDAVGNKRLVGGKHNVMLTIASLLSILFMTGGRRNVPVLVEDGRVKQIGRQGRSCLV